MARLAPKQSVVKRLFSLSGNICAFPDCKNTHILEGVVIGKVAHICAAEVGGPRYDVTMSDEERRAFDNLILLCPTHHDLVDKLHEKYDADLLRQMKRKHEMSNEASSYAIPDSALDSVIDELNINQSNILYNGTQNNYQNIQLAGDNLQDFLDKSSSGLARMESVTEPEDADDIADDKGYLEGIEEATVTIPMWTQTIQESSNAISSVAPIMDSAVKEMSRSDQRGEGIQGRIRVLKKAATNLMPVADRIYELGEKFNGELQIIDRGIGAIISLHEFQEDKSSLEGFANDIRQMTSSADYGLGALDGLLDNMRQLEVITSAMKKPIQRMREGLNLMKQGKPVIKGWLSRLEGITSQ